MKNYITIIIFIFLGSYIIRENPLRGEREKVEIHFLREFKYIDNFYLLNEVLSAKEKEELLQSLKESSKQKREELFKKITIEKKEIISKIPDYKKEKLRTEIEEQKNMEKNLFNFFESNLSKIAPIIIFIFTAICIGFGIFLLDIVFI